MSADSIESTATTPPTQPERRFTVAGPIRGKGRPRFARCGKFTRTYSDSKTVSYENWIRACYLQAHPGAPLIPRDQPVYVHIAALFPVPKSWSKKRQAATMYHLGKPDGDNVLKAVCDSLNGIAWVDDSCVGEAIVRKYMSMEGAVGLSVKIGFLGGKS